MHRNGPRVSRHVSKTAAAWKFADSSPTIDAVPDGHGPNRAFRSAGAPVTAIGTRRASCRAVVEWHTPLLEIVARVTLVYVGLVVMVRLAGKREIGQLAPLDLLAMLLLSETVSPALTAQDPSLVASLVAAGTLLGLTALTSRLTYRSRRLEGFLEGRPVVLVERGRLDEAVARRERFSVQDVEVALRKHGVETISTVHRATIEPDGSISVIAAMGRGA